MNIKRQVTAFSPEAKAKPFRPGYSKGIGNFTRNPGASSYTIVSLLRKRDETLSGSVRDGECVPEAEFIFTPGDDFYIVMAISDRFAVFAKANNMRLNFEERTGHFFISAGDFEKLRDEFLAAPERMLVYESLAAAGVVDRRFSAKLRAH